MKKLFEKIIEGVLACSGFVTSITIVLITHSEQVARKAHRRIRMLDGHAEECGADGEEGVSG